MKSEKGYSIMRTKLEKMLVVAGLLLALGTVGELTISGIVYATGCTSACGPDTNLCSGTNSSASCFECTSIDGRQYRNPITRGTTNGSITTTTQSVVCYILTPCVFSHNNIDYGLSCVSSGCLRDPHGTIITQCPVYTTSTPVNQTVSTCIGNGCEEK
jgi:hypothetical protein